MRRITNKNVQNISAIDGEATRSESVQAATGAQTIVGCAQFESDTISIAIHYKSSHKYLSECRTTIGMFR